MVAAAGSRRAGRRSVAAGAHEAGTEDREQRTLSKTRAMGGASCCRQGCEVAEDMLAAVTEASAAAGPVHIEMWSSSSGETQGHGSTCLTGSI